jgi:hypothetical protein
MGVMQRGALLAMASVDGIEGRAARFEAVFTAHSGVIYAYARRRVTKEEAEDVVSEAFLVAWRRLDDLPAEPVPWLEAAEATTLRSQGQAPVTLVALSGSAHTRQLKWSRPTLRRVAWSLPWRFGTLVQSHERV